MGERDSAAIILAAGEGTRMKSAKHKVLHAVGGLPVINHLMATLDEVGSSRRVVVIGAGGDQLRAALPDVDFARQDPPMGTGHAVQCARGALKGFDGNVLLLAGDVPLVRAATLTRMLEALEEDGTTAVVVLGFRPEDTKAYGRLITDADGTLTAIVEHLEADAATRAITLCNSGLIAVRGDVLFDLVDAIGNDNSKGEYYLPDIVGIAAARGLRSVVIEAPADEVAGINTRADLAQVEAIFQREARARAMAGGATLQDPDTVYFSHDTALGTDVTVGPQVVFGPGVTVGDGVLIQAFSHIEGATIAPGASIGPFARLRPGADIGNDAKIGNFVEVKKAVIEAGAKVSHLSYIGDARVGEGANIGAGTITCNYNGYFKNHTDIGAGAFIGSNTALVAPVSVGDGAIIGAGSVITSNVEADALAVSRGESQEKAGWAKRFRKAQSAKKARKKS